MAMAPALFVTWTGAPPADRHLPDARLSTFETCRKVDPLAVAREAWIGAARRAFGDVSRLATTGRHNQHVGPPVRIAVERNHRLVGRPLRVSGKDRHRRQLERVRPVRDRQPRIRIRQNGPTGRQPGGHRVSGWESGHLALTRSRQLAARRLEPRAAPCRRATRSSRRSSARRRAAALLPALATRRACYRPDRRMAAGLACRPSRYPASTARLGPRTEFHGCRGSTRACLRRGSTSGARIAFGIVRVLQREPVELTAQWRGVPAKDQHGPVR